MNNLLLAASIAGVAVVLVAANYPDLADHAKNRALYDAIAGAEPEFEPRIVAPLVNPPDVEYDYSNTFGYTRAEHNPADDSVTITYDYSETVSSSEYARMVEDGTIPSSGIKGLCHTCGDGSEGIHVRTYLPGQTFVYSCSDLGGHVEVLLSRYLGTEMLQGRLSFVFVHFEVRLSEDVSCTFPHYLAHGTDVFDAGGLVPDASVLNMAHGNATAEDLVGFPVVTSPIYTRVLPVHRLGAEEFASEGRVRIEEFELGQDDSLALTYRDVVGGGGVVGAAHVQTYKPGQTFLVDCRERGSVTSISVYNYRGVEDLGGTDHVVLALFKAYTRGPVPCLYPDYLEGFVDSFDAGALDRQHDMEWYRNEPSADVRMG